MDTSRDGGGEVYSWKLGRDGVEMGLTYDVSMTSMFITDWIFFFYKLLYQIPYESAKSINFKFDRKLFSQLFVFSSRINAISNVMAASNFIWAAQFEIIESFRNAVCNSRTRVSPPSPTLPFDRKCR